MSDDPCELPPWYCDAWRAAQTGIGRDLRAFYDPPKDVPESMLALLARLDRRQELK
jgi:hypothetical protein